MTNNDINFEEKIELTGLLTELIIMDATPTNNENAIYSVIPRIIRQFSGARVHSGFRLCKRAIRHAMDPKAVDIRACNGHVIKYNSKIGLDLQH